MKIVLACARAGSIGALVTAAAPNLFGADVFLASVYAVSMYTLLRMRMSREFNRVVPALPDLVRRLLGVYYLPARQLVPEGLGQCP